jgi:type II secretory pathway pseudopilin PulG
MLCPMPSIHYLKSYLRTGSNQGYSYVEALVASIIVTITLSVMGPLFINQRAQNVQNRVQTAAIAVAQYELEGKRQQMDIDVLPVNTEVPAAFTRTMLGQNFAVTVIVRDFGTANTNGTFTCRNLGQVSTSSVSRCVDIEVRKGASAPSSDTPIYKARSVFTKFDDRR